LADRVTRFQRMNLHQQNIAAVHCSHCEGRS
jgi:hypothetical protein